MLKRIASLVGAAAFAFAVFAGCNDSPASPDMDSFDKAAIANSTDVPYESGDLLFRDPPGTPPGEMGGRNPGFRSPGMNLARLIRLLDLSADETAAMQECLEAYKECMQEENASFREARQELMTEFREDAAEIRERLADGEIDEETAREEMRALAQSVRADLRQLMEDHAEALTACRTTLRSCVDEFLDDDQMAIWDRFMNPTPRRR